MISYFPSFATLCVGRIIRCENTVFPHCFACCRDRGHRLLSGQRAASFCTVPWLGRTYWHPTQWLDIFKHELRQRLAEPTRGPRESLASVRHQGAVRAFLRLCLLLGLLVRLPCRLVQFVYARLFKRSAASELLPHQWFIATAEARSLISMHSQH
jgi:hypothetical protein